MTTKLSHEAVLRESVGIGPGDVWPAVAWPGAYPVVYLAADGGVLCALCVNDENSPITYVHPDRSDYPNVLVEDAQWAIVEARVYYEGPTLECANCGASIESAYGDPDT